MARNRRSFDRKRPSSPPTQPAFPIPLAGDHVLSVVRIRLRAVRRLGELLKEFDAPFDYLLASVDCAFTSKEENDFSAFTLWGVFSEGGTADGAVDELTGKIWHSESNRQRKIMLVAAWKKRLEFSSPRIPRLTEPTMIDGAKWPADYVEPGMDPSVIAFRESMYRKRTMAKWGLIEHLYESSTSLNGRPIRIDRLLIEAKANGLSVAQELRNRYGPQNFTIEPVPVKGDKVARVLQVLPTFTNGLVYAPNKPWAEAVIDECEIFPRGRHDDFVDSTTQALKHLRDYGLAQTAEEITEAERDRARHWSPRKQLYPV
jgi:predicted phage terminase large subunit-like protein